MGEVPVEHGVFQQKVNEAPGLVPMIMVFVDDMCLSPYYAGELKVYDFLVFDAWDSVEPFASAVEAEHWRETCGMDLSLDKSAYPPCELCGIVDDFQLHVFVAYVHVALHRKLTHLPYTEHMTACIGDESRFDRRLICRECVAVMYTTWDL